MTLTTMTTATTSFGRLRGAIDEGVLAFRGIPYAQPPIGPLRFAPPARLEGWSGTRSADRFGPAAMQTEGAVPGERLVDRTDENCLWLNVWTPALDDRRRPVLVWLHGGGFVSGAGSGPMCNGATLARRGDAVVVTINYRLGLFGYLRGIDVCGESLPSTGNEGLLDQLAALTWVHEEIAAFGGDPANVTIFGGSAGALSIGLMLAMPRARGLFQKAIMQSAPAFSNSWGAARVMEAILADLGLAPSEAGRLRDLPAAQLLDIQTRVTPRSAGVAYGPVADGTDVPTDPEAVIAGGSAAGIPLLVGTNLEEYRFFRRMDRAVESLTDETLLARLADPRTTAEARDHASVDPAEAVALYRRERASRGEPTDAPELWFAMMTDRHFRVPNMRLAKLHADHTPATYAYLFTWKSPGWDGQRGASHEVNTPFVFGTYDIPEARGTVTPSAEVERLCQQMQDAWIAFARTGSPSTPGLPDWDPYTAGRRSTMLLGTSCRAVDAPYEAERHFWADARASRGSHA
jgi:para-nitrobenzyl esterase